MDFHGNSIIFEKIGLPLRNRNFVFCNFDEFLCFSYSQVKYVLTTTINVNRALCIMQYVNVGIG